MEKSTTRPTRNLNDAIARATDAIIRTQRSDGAWDGQSELGPLCTAQALIALSYLRRLSAADAQEGARWLAGQQRHDGSFGAYPFAEHGDLGATACAWAAMQLANDHHPAIAGAAAFIEKNGGLNAVAELSASGDVAPIYLALAGRLDAARLPHIPLAWVLVPGIVEAAMKRVNYSIVLGALSLSIIGQRLRGKWGPDGTRQHSWTRLACERAMQLLSTFQNPNGSFNSVTIETAIFAATLQATGRPQDAARASHAAAWLESRAIRDADGLHFDIFPSDIWTTAYHLRVLAEAGVKGAVIERATEYLLQTPSNVLQPHYDNAKRNAVRRGGWAFEDGNPLMPDPDDTGVVLCALGAAQAIVPAALAARVRDAVDHGRAWLLDMQNPDGGWPGYAWGLPSKSRGPAMTAPFQMHPLALLAALFKPPVILGDPSTEDLSARALEGLLATGASASALQKALGFFRAQQCDNGAWWGRWVVNYLAGTAYVLSALVRAKEDLSAPYVQRAIDFVLAHQNDDGGFGESVASYVAPSLAGHGASTAPLTGLVLTALVDVGLGEREETQRALAYLLARQRPDGTWPNGHYLATALPPTAFYTYAPAANYLPLQALARYAHRHAPTALQPSASRWSDAVLDRMRQTTDPLAEDLVASVYRADAEDSVNPLLMLLFRNDDPIPPGLPAPIQKYFEETAPLPEWAEPEKIAQAQELFAAYGAQITMGLFCSSLPQAYAAAKGASVLVQTEALERNTRQRVFETAQFVFDVLDTSAFTPEGRGIRAAQRVRLMHAAIRHLILRKKTWDTAARGKPINQEDLAGTLMTFSAVTFDALRRYGVEVSDAQGEAWIHAWNVVGHYLGIERSLMPESLAEAEALMQAIRRRQWNVSAEGKNLTRALLEMMDRFFTFDITAFSGFIPTQIRFLAGDHCAELIGVPQSHLEGLLSLASRIAEGVGFLDHEQLTAETLGKIAKEGMKAIIFAEREGKQASFRLPESLHRAVMRDT